MCVAQKRSTRGGLKPACPPAMNHVEEKEKRDERRAERKQEPGEETCREVRQPTKAAAVCQQFRGSFRRQ